MILNFSVMCIGLIICFGGIYFKRVIAAMTGLVWGSLLGVVITLLTAATLYDIDEKLPVYMVGCALVMGIACAIHDRLCSAITAFLITFVACIFAAILNINAVRTILIIAFMISMFMAYLSYLFDRVAFVLITAFGGACIANIGAYGLVHHLDLGEMLAEMIVGYFTGFFSIIAGTIVLGCIGCYVQHLRCVAEEDRQSLKKEPTSNDTGKKLTDIVEKNEKAFYEDIFDREIDFDLLLLVIPCVSYIAMSFVHGSATWNETDYRVLFEVKRFLNAASVAALGYYVSTQNFKRNVLYQIPYAIVEIGPMLHMPSAYHFFELIRFLSTGMVLAGISECEIAKKKKGFVITSAAYAWYYLVFPVIEGIICKTGYSFHLKSQVISILEVYAIAYYIYMVLRDENIFELLKGVSFGKMQEFCKTEMEHGGYGNKRKNKMAIGLIIAFCVIGVGMAVGGKAVVHYRR